MVGSHPPFYVRKDYTFLGSRGGWVVRGVPGLGPGRLRLDPHLRRPSVSPDLPLCKSVNTDNLFLYKLKQKNFRSDFEIYHSSILPTYKPSINLSS